VAFGITGTGGRGSPRLPQAITSNTSVATTFFTRAGF